ncbi:MAG: MarR family transcriptional regulator [Polyangiaceae bacterium]
MKTKPMAKKDDAARIWTLDYRLVMSVIVAVAPALGELGVEVKELFVLAAIDEHPHPGDLATALSMPKPSVTVYVKRLESVGLVKREIDAEDLRRYRLTLTSSGRSVMTRGQALLSEAFGRRLGKLTSAEQAELKGFLERMSRD